MENNPTTENKSTTQTFEVSTPGQPFPSVVKILTETSDQLTKSYERLKWLGFTSTAGALIIVMTFILSVTPAIKLPFESQVLFTVVGFCMLLLLGSLFAVQNVHAYRLETKNRDFALKSLELQHPEKTAIIQQPAATPASSYTPPGG